MAKPVQSVAQEAVGCAPLREPSAQAPSFFHQSDKEAAGPVCPYQASPQPARRSVDPGIAGSQIHYKMKPSCFFLWPLSAGLAVASVIDRRDPAPAERPGILVARQATSFWNDFSVPVNDAYACTIFSALEWLAFSLIEPAQDITAEAGTRVHVAPEAQGGPLVVCVRRRVRTTEPGH